MRDIDTNVPTDSKIVIDGLYGLQFLTDFAPKERTGGVNNKKSTRPPLYPKTSKQRTKKVRRFGIG